MITNKLAIKSENFFHEIREKILLFIQPRKIRGLIDNFSPRVWRGGFMGVVILAAAAMVMLAVTTSVSLVVIEKNGYLTGFLGKVVMALGGAAVAASLAGAALLFI